jgi:hypothetical protein
MLSLLERLSATSFAKRLRKRTWGEVGLREQRNDAFREKQFLAPKNPFLLLLNDGVFDVN